jgi:hypothetical protein
VHPDLARSFLSCERLTHPKLEYPPEARGLWREQDDRQQTTSAGVGFWYASKAWCKHGCFHWRTSVPHEVPALRSKALGWKLLNRQFDRQNRVVSMPARMWRNWYTRTFEGRVALPCEFESRHPHFSYFMTAAMIDSPRHFDLSSFLRDTAEI